MSIEKERTNMEIPIRPRLAMQERLKDVEEESERRRLAIENLLLQALENGKEIERLNKKIGELFKERDELYDKYVHKCN